MMHNALVMHLLASRRRQKRRGHGRIRGHGDLRVPRAGLRPPLTMLTLFGIDMVDRADAARRAGRRGRRGELVNGTTRRSRACGRADPTRTPAGSVVTQDVAGGSRRCRRPPPTSGSSGTTPTPSTTSPRTRRSRPTSSRWCRPRGTRTARSPSRRRGSITLPVPGSPFLAASRETMATEVPRPPQQYASIGPDKVNQLRHVAALPLAGGRARAHAAAPRRPGAEVRGGRRRTDPLTSCKGAWVSRNGRSRPAATS